MFKTTNKVVTMLSDYTTTSGIYLQKGDKLDVKYNPDKERCYYEECYLPSMVYSFDPVTEDTYEVTHPTSTSVQDILAQRGARYGEFRNVAATYTELKASIYTENFRTTADATVVMAVDMICQKLARIANGDVAYADNYVDIAGYAQLVVDDLEG